MTIGVASDSGRFRLTWEARHEHPEGAGTFRLTVHSAVSGRPMQVLADLHGEGDGTAIFEDNPRLYTLMIDSANVDWSVVAEHLVVIDAAGSPPSSRRDP